MASTIFIYLFNLLIHMTIYMISIINIVLITILLLLLLLSLLYNFVCVGEGSSFKTSER